MKTIEQTIGLCNHNIHQWKYLSNVERTCIKCNIIEKLENNTWIEDLNE